MVDSEPVSESKASDLSPNPHSSARKRTGIDAEGQNCTSAPSEDDRKRTLALVKGFLKGDVIDPDVLLGCAPLCRSIFEEKNDGDDDGEGGSVGMKGWGVNGQKRQGADSERSKSRRSLLSNVVHSAVNGIEYFITSEIVADTLQSANMMQSNQSSPTAHGRSHGHGSLTAAAAGAGATEANDALEYIASGAAAANHLVQEIIPVPSTATNTLSVVASGSVGDDGYFLSVAERLARAQYVSTCLETLCVCALLLGREFRVHFIEVRIK